MDNRLIRTEMGEKLFEDAINRGCVKADPLADGALEKLRGGTIKTGREASLSRGEKRGKAETKV